MAKKKQKHKKNKKGAEQVALPTPVGWGFWLVAFLVLFGPMTYAIYLITEEDRRDTLLPWILGFSTAAILAGFLSAGINSILDLRARRILKNRNKPKG